MADNYLENRYAEVFGSDRVVRKTTKANSLNTLLLKNRSHRVYNQNFSINEAKLKEIVDVVWKVPSARNQQVLRYKLLSSDSEYLKIIKDNIRLGGHSTTADIAPSSYIIICSTIAESHYVSVDLGIAAQSILLKAVELGLRGICIGAFNKVIIKEVLNLPYEPLLIIGIGQSDEKIQIINIPEGSEQKYYEKDGIHYVPKLSLKDLIL